MAFPKQAKFDPLRTRFDSFFEEMIQNGTFTTLGQKYRVTLPYLTEPTLLIMHDCSFMYDRFNFISTRLTYDHMCDKGRRESQLTVRRAQ